MFCVTYRFFYNFAFELTWTDLNCLQPQEKMLK